LKIWLLLLIAILFEVTASLSMSAAQNNPYFYVLTVLGYATALWLLGRILKMGMPIAVAYGLWGSLGVVLTAVFSFLLLNEAMSLQSALGIAVIVFGIVLIQIGDYKKNKTSNTGAESR
jgi:small multidrug resistance pump